MRNRPLFPAFLAAWMAGPAFGGAVQRPTAPRPAAPSVRAIETAVPPPAASVIEAPAADRAAAASAVAPAPAAAQPEPSESDQRARDALGRLFEGSGFKVAGPRLPELPGVSHVVFDMRDSRGGNGDVAAGYLTATDLIMRRSLNAPSPRFTFIVDEDALNILTRMHGRPVAPGSTLYNRIQVHTIASLPKDTPPADVYLLLARAKATLERGRDLRRVDAPFAVDAGAIPATTRTVMLVQPVLGNTEDWYGRHPHALVKVGDLRLDMATAGVGEAEQGVYGDFVARGLSGLAHEQVHQYLRHAVETIRDTKDRLVLRRVIGRKSLQGAQVGLVYGIHSEKQKTQFRQYLVGLAKAAQEQGRSFALFSPLAFERDFLYPELREQVVVSGPKTAVLPEKAEPGKVYVIRTKALPHRVFVGLMAFSEFPPVISGDGAMSAAIALGRPFLMTRVDWNEKNIARFKARLSAGADPAAAKLYEAVYGGELDLQRGLELQAHAKDFERLRDEVPTLTESLVAAIRAARKADDLKTAMAKVVSGIADPTLKQSLMSARRVVLQEAVERPATRQLALRRAERDGVAIALRPSILKRLSLLRRLRRLFGRLFFWLALWSDPHVWLRWGQGPAAIVSVVPDPKPR